MLLCCIAQVTALVTCMGWHMVLLSQHMSWVEGVPACPMYDPHHVVLLGRACAPAQVVSVQYQVVDSQAFDDGHNDSSLKLAFYKLTNPHRQITSCVAGPCCYVTKCAAG